MVNGMLSFMCKQEGSSSYPQCSCYKSGVSVRASVTPGLWGTEKELTVGLPTGCQLQVLFQGNKVERARVGHLMSSFGLQGHAYLCVCSSLHTRMGMPSELSASNVMQISQLSFYLGLWVLSGSSMKKHLS